MAQALPEKTLTYEQAVNLPFELLWRWSIEQFGQITRILPLINQKGGVSKTTTARNLIQFLYANLVRLKAPLQSVVGVDSDGQSHLSKSFRVDATGRKHLYHVYRQRNLYLEETLLKHPRGEIFLAPTSDDLYAIDSELAPTIHIKDATSGTLQAITNMVEDLYWYEVLREKIKHLIGHVGYLIIDCPPSLGPLTINALVAATGAVIPSQTSFLSYDGLGMIHKTISLVQQSYNPTLDIVGIIPTLFDTRVGLEHDVLRGMRKYYSENLIDIPIPRWAPFAESIPKGMAVNEYKPHTEAVKVMQQVTVEIMRRDLLLQIKQREQQAA
jgi:chromosome partitioning protein